MKSRMFIPLNVFCILFAILSSGCAVLEEPTVPSRPQTLRPIVSAEFPRCFDDMAYDGLATAVSRSLSYLRRLPPSRIFFFGNDVYTTGHMVVSHERFLDYIATNPSTEDLKEFIKQRYRIYHSVGRDGRGTMLFTGYYEPVLEGSKKKTETYRFPVYGRPDDLLTVDLSSFSPKFQGEKIIARFTGETLLPYHDRKSIDFHDAIEGKAKVIAWVADRIGLFFLQIQGSGKIYLENGEICHVHYHTTNGLPYRSIGKLLIEEGKIPKDEMSMQRIRAYLEQHPEEIPDVLGYNPSYVFFKIEPDGPIGSLDEKLTPGRSIATDPRLFPPGALAFIETQKPLVNGDGRIDRWVPLSRFVLNQDTGGAIQGPGRVDLFWGNGVYAEISAGHMKHGGSLYFLVLKSDALKPD